MERRQIFLQNRQLEWFRMQPEARELVNRLQEAYPGTIVVSPFYESELDELLTDGYFLKDMQVKYLHMESNECHRNSAEVWIEHIRKHCQNGDFSGLNVHLYTGYMKNPDDYVWRQHSWVVSDLTILETTVEVEQYYGVPLSFQDALIHAKNEGVLSQKECGEWFTEFTK